MALQRLGCQISDIATATGTITATPSVSSYLLQYSDNSWVPQASPTLSVAVTAGSRWSLSLPSHSDCLPSQLQWTIVTPDSSQFTGAVTDNMVADSQVSALTTYNLQATYNWSYQDSTVQGQFSVTGNATNIAPITISNTNANRNQGSIQSATEFGVTTSSNFAIILCAGSQINSTFTPASGVLARSSAAASVNWAHLMAGHGAFDGSSAGHFVGSANGTIIGGNAASGFTGNLIDLQLSGVSKFSVASNGDITSGIVFSSTVRASFGLTLTNTNTLATQDLVTMTSLGNLTASSGTQNGLKVNVPLLQTSTAGYTALLVNAVETSTGSGTKSLADFQVGGVSKASISNTGALAFSPATTATAPGAGGAGALPATPLGYLTVTVNGAARQIAYY